MVFVFFQNIQLIHLMSVHWEPMSFHGPIWTLLAYSALSGYCYWILTFSVPGAWPWPWMVVFGASGRSGWLHAVFFSVMNWRTCSGQVVGVIVTCLKEIRRKTHKNISRKSVWCMWSYPSWIRLQKQSESFISWYKWYDCELILFSCCLKLQLQIRHYYKVNFTLLTVLLNIGCCCNIASLYKCSI